MRLTYNYTTDQYALHTENSENDVLFGVFLDADTDEATTPFIREHDTFVTYDIEHWEWDELNAWTTLHSDYRRVALESVPRIRSGIYGVIGIIHDTPV